MQYSWTKDVAEAKEYFSNFGDKVDTWKTVLGTDEKNAYPAQVAAAVFSPAIKIPFDLVKDEIINTAIAAKFVVNTVGNAIALLSEKEESEKIEEKPPEYIVPQKVTKESKQIEKQAQKDIKEANKYNEQITELEQMADDLYQTIYFDYADIQSTGSLEQLEQRYQQLEQKQDALAEKINSLFSKDEQRELKVQEFMDKNKLAQSNDSGNTKIADAGQSKKIDA